MSVGWMDGWMDAEINGRIEEQKEGGRGTQKIIVKKYGIRQK
jgi:hypothetical protein